jgi:hypothetical protein
MSHDPFEEQAFMVLPLLWRGMPQQVADQQTTGGERERERHVCHGPFGGGDPGLVQDLQAVGDRLDPGVGPGSQRVSPQQDQHDGHETKLTEVAVQLDMSRADYLGQRPEVAHDSIADEQDVRGDEDQKDRQQDLDRLLDAPQVQHQQHEKDSDVERHLVRLPIERQEVRLRPPRANRKVMVRR